MFRGQQGSTSSDFTTGCSKRPQCPLRLIAVLDAHLEGLVEFFERGRIVGDGVRELIVRFGGANYVIRYDVGPDDVAIARIWHGLENR